MTASLTPLQRIAVDVQHRNRYLRDAPAYPYYTPPAYPLPTFQMSTWNLIDGYLRVEYRDAAGAYHPITQEWLNLGFARGTTPPIAPGTNPVNPNAILILQQTCGSQR